MKAFASILSLYILFLTALPCVDKPDSCDLQATVLSIPQGNHVQDVDHCSPFCTCNCCSSPKIQEDCTVQFNSFEILLACISGQVLMPVATHTGNIWQPPRLG